MSRNAVTGAAETRPEDTPLDPVEEAMGLQELGERDFLREHLAREVLRLRETVQERDRAIAALNREIGALDRQQVPAARSSVDWRAAFTRLLAVLRKAKLWRKAGKAVPPKSDIDETQFWGMPQRDPLVPFGPDNIGKKLIAVTIFGLDREATRKVLKTVDRYREQHDVVPVILTDSVWTEDLREGGFAFEYIPAAEVRERISPGLDWELYVQRKMRLLRRKWAPDGIISFGRPLHPHDEQSLSREAEG